MKNILLSILLFSIIISCSKEKTEPRRNVCAYGISKLTKKKELITCVPYEIYLCNDNQECANKKAELFKFPYENVAIMSKYTQLTSIPSDDCNCKP